MGYKSDWFDLSEDRLSSPVRPMLVKSVARKLSAKCHLDFTRCRLNQAKLLRAYGLLAQDTFRQCHGPRYPVVWFHSVWAGAACLPLLSNHQRVVLQSYSPELPHQELAAIPGSEADVKWSKWAEKQIFHRATDVVFPNPGSREIYESLLNGHSEIHYLPYGARKPAEVTRVPLDPQYIYLLYIGRRLAIKGYDIVIAAFREAYRLNPRLRLILVGAGDRVTEPGVIDVGLSRRPWEWLASADYVLSCNRQSYLDLVVLETLAIGTPLIMSATSGHQAFANAGTKGIINIGPATVHNLREALLALKRGTQEAKEMREDNIRLFSSRYSDALYRRNLEMLCRRLVEDTQSAGTAENTDAPAFA